MDRKAYVEAQTKMLNKRHKIVQQDDDIFNICVHLGDVKYRSTNEEMQWEHTLKGTYVMFSITFTTGEEGEERIQAIVPNLARTDFYRDEYEQGWTHGHVGSRRIGSFAAFCIGANSDVDKITKLITSETITESNDVLYYYMTSFINGCVPWEYKSGVYISYLSMLENQSSSTRSYFPPNNQYYNTRRTQEVSNKNLLKLLSETSIVLDEDDVGLIVNDKVVEIKPTKKLVEKLSFLLISKLNQSTQEDTTRLKDLADTLLYVQCEDGYKYKFSYYYTVIIKSNPIPSIREQIRQLEEGQERELEVEDANMTLAIFDKEVPIKIHERNDSNVNEIEYLKSKLLHYQTLQSGEIKPTFNGIFQITPVYVTYATRKYFDAYVQQAGNADPESGESEGDIEQAVSETS